MRIDSMNLGQRIVLVVASGLALWVLTWWIVAEDTLGGGWFGYGPDVDVGISQLHAPGSSRFSNEVVALVYGAAIVLWAFIGVRLLRDRQRPE